MPRVVTFVLSKFFENIPIGVKLVEDLNHRLSIQTLAPLLAVIFFSTFKSKLKSQVPGMCDGYVPDCTVVQVAAVFEENEPLPPLAIDFSAAGHELSGIWFVVPE